MIEVLSQAMLAGLASGVAITVLRLMTDRR